MEKDQKEAEEAELEVEEARNRARSPRTVYWRFRDSYLFVPLVAIVVIILLLGGLLAYTQTWPPIYVVESSSMQHGTSDVLGVINAGDMVLSQQVGLASITTYIAGMSGGYQTYGEYGDVLLYQPNGGSGTPVIHRALLFLDYDPLNGTYNASALAGLPCGAGTPGAVYSISDHASGCGPYGMSGTLTLYHIGWQGATVVIPLAVINLGTHSGFLTMGDNNFETSRGADPNCSGSSCRGTTDQTDGLSQLVTSAWIVGVARGLVPWFGGLRLLLTGGAAAVPSQSWELMALTVVAVVLAGFALHYAWKSFRPPDRRRVAVEERRREEEEADETEEDEEPGAPRRRWFHRRARGEDEPEEPSVKTASRSRGRKPSGRPTPSIRRWNGGRTTSRSSRRDDDDTL